MVGDPAGNILPWREEYGTIADMAAIAANVFKHVRSRNVVAASLAVAVAKDPKGADTAEAWVIVMDEVMMDPEARTFAAMMASVAGAGFHKEAMKAIVNFGFTLMDGEEGIPLEQWRFRVVYTVLEDAIGSESEAFTVVTDTVENRTITAKMNPDGTITMMETFEHLRDIIPYDIGSDIVAFSDGRLVCPICGGNTELVDDVYKCLRCAREYNARGDDDE